MRYTPDRRCAGRATGAAAISSWLALFRGTDLAAVARAIGDCDVIAVPAGTPLLKPGDANDTVYVLLAGRVAAYLDSARGCRRTRSSSRPGECIGELSAIDGKPASALVLAQSDARVLTLPRDLFWSRLMSMPAVGRNLLAALAERMRRSQRSDAGGAAQAPRAGVPAAGAGAGAPAAGRHAAAAPAAVSGPRRTWKSRG